MSKLSPLQFAIQASDRLQQVSHDLCRDNSCVQFCASLEATLSNVLRWLQTLPDSKDSQREANGLLNVLESLSQTSNHPEQPSSALQGLESRYPALALLLKDSGPAKLAVQDLASSNAFRRRRKQLLALLDFYLPQDSDDKVDVSPSNADLQALSEDPPECGREISSLYNTLYTHCFCNQSGEVVARIRLRSNSSKDGEVIFGVLFKAHPHQDGDDLRIQPLWQDTHISVSRTVTFKGSKISELEEVGLDPEMPFCSYISTQEEEGRVELYFSITGGKLYFKEGLDPTRHWRLDRPSISLGRLLEEVSQSTDDLTEKRKEVLSWLLAKAVWQYYSSPWMLQPWTKETVHFLFERRQYDSSHSVTGIFVNEPLLSVSIAPVASKEGNGLKLGSKARPSLRSRGPLQQVPKIVHLGIMLIEIQLGRSIESLYEEPELDLIGKPSFFTDLDISDPLEALIRKCLEPKDVFMPPHVRNEEGIREALYNLVNRLEVYVSKRKPHNIKPLSLPKATSQYHLSRTPSPLPPGQARPPSLSPRPPAPGNYGKRSRSGRTMAENTNSPTTRDWFKRMDSLNYILKAADGDVYEKVKIAVLDTGVSPLDAAADFITGYKDFVHGDDSVKCDNTGHGTTSVNLIFDMCESADVYALRIFETDVASDNTRELAIKAIDWCIAEGIDVICMACGFQGFDQELYDRIHDASGKMLIFAAPTNESNVSEIAYPARHHAEVFCTFSTDGCINTSRRLNPTIGVEGYNFAILGENIKTFSGEEKSGTSFSTAIAAGLAARLLDFSKHRDCQGKLSRHASMMKIKYGMSKVLCAMSIADAGFQCLKPWQLLPKDLREHVPFDEYGPPDEIKKQLARAHICSIILHSLDEDLGPR